MQISPWSLRFRAREDEAAYGTFDPDGELAPARAIVVTIILFLIADLVLGLIAEDLWVLFRMLEAALALGLAAYLAFTRTEWSRRQRRPLTAVGFLAVQIGLVPLVAAADASYARTMFAVSLLLMLVNATLPYGWRAKIAMNALTAVVTAALARASALFGKIEVHAITNFMLLGMAVAATIAYFHERERRRRFQAEHRAAEILHNVLPSSIVARLTAAGPGTRIVEAGEAAVLFADIVGFTPFAARSTPLEVVETLDRLFGRFDAVIAQHGLEKIKTIGDAYMAVAGMPTPRPDAALAAAETALDLLAVVERLKALGGIAFDVRIGLHIGPVVAGIIGTHRFAYDLWGDTVNVAARLESLGVPGRIQISGAMAGAVAGHFAVEPRGRMELRGRGEIDTFFLVGRAVQREAA